MLKPTKLILVYEYGRRKRIAHLTLDAVTDALTMCGIPAVYLAGRRRNERLIAATLPRCPTCNRLANREGGYVVHAA